MYVNIRSPNNFIFRWFFIFGLVFFVAPKNVFAYPIGNTNTSYIDSVITECKANGYSYIVYELKTKVGNDKEMDSVHCAYSSSPVAYVDGVGFTGTFVSKYEGWHYRLNCISSSESGLPNTVYEISFDPSFYNSSPTTCYSFTLLDVDIVDYAEGSDVYGSLDYNIDDLKSYPIDTINVTSPVSESNIKTNGRFVNVAIKGKVGIDCTDDIAVTKEDLGKLIRNNFRYSFKSDKESFDSISYLGPVIETSRGQSPDDDILDILQVLGSEFPIVRGEQIKIAPLNDNWTIGVSGNAKDWNSKKYYNFIINTALYVGENDGDYTYKLNFKVPVGFGMNITYKTITVDYKLSRGSYVDDDFNGIDDNTNEIIPVEEVEIINPSTSTPVLPSDDGLDDGLQVVSILKDIYKDFCNGVNGSVNILKSFFSVVNSTVQSVVNYSEEMVISFSNIFGFMPSPVPQLITMSLAIMIFVSVLGFIKK